MYHIDLDYNAFSGELPYLSCCLKNLHKVSFEHNAFTGSVTDDHFIEFAMGQKPSVESALSLVGNRLSGPLPSIFYSFYYDAATTLTYFSAKDNHFRCSPDHENEYFEDWAHNLAEDVGMCEPVATPGAVSAPDAARAGDEITVAGEAFAATTESTCKFTYDAGGSDVVPAFFYSAAEVRCSSRGVFLLFEAVFRPARVRAARRRELPAGRPNEPLRYDADAVRSRPTVPQARCPRTRRRATASSPSRTTARTTATRRRSATTPP